MNVDLVGFAAAFFSTVCFIPQVIRVLKTRHTKSISLPMYIILISGSLLWVVYGIMTKSAPVIVANTIIFVLGGIILVAKIKNG